MGINIEMHNYSFSRLCDELIKHGCGDIDIIKDVLLSCGTKIGDRYIILNNEYYEDENCFFTIGGLLDGIFGIEDCFDVFCLNKNTDEIEMISYIDPFDVEEKYRLEKDEEGYYYKKGKQINPPKSP